MIAEKVYEIVDAPKTYVDWLDCFEVLSHKNVSKSELQLLSMGECVASEESIEFLETQMIKTINIMIRRYIQSINKELELHMMYNEYDNIYQLFINLANKFNGCMFFLQLDFMSVKFRKELRSSIIHETKKFWQLMINTMYSQCIEQNNLFLEDELYMIKRIKLFS